MAQMDGYETSRRIRSGQAGPHYTDIPIIAMTANAMQGDKEKCLDAGMSDYLSKPINPQHLSEKLVSWLLGKNTVTPLNNKSPSNEIEKTEYSATDESKLIWDHDSALKRMRGRKDRLLKIIDLFIADMPDRIEVLKKAQLSNDKNEIQLIAHTIKGVAANLDGNILLLTANELETFIKQNDNYDSAQLSPLITKVITAYDDFYSLLTEYTTKA